MGPGVKALLIIILIGAKQKRKRLRSIVWSEAFARIPVRGLAQAGYFAMSLSDFKARTLTLL